MVTRGFSPWGEAEDGPVGHGKPRAKALGYHLRSPKGARENVRILIRLLRLRTENCIYSPKKRILNKLRTFRKKKLQLMYTGG